MITNAYFPKLFERGQIGKVEVRNRIVMSPMGLHYLAGINGEVTDDTIAYYVERAKGGVGLIVVGVTNIMPTPQKVTSPLLSLGVDKFTRGHYYLTEAVHAYGAKISVQLVHMGAQMSLAAHGGRPTLSPSGVPMSFVDGTVYEPPRPMTRNEIYEMIEHFAAAAGRAKDAGYDMVDLHGAHGYLICQFMSPHTNKRADEFGSSLENRMRFPIEIIKRIKQVVGDDYPIGFRISADEFLEDGITTKESPIMAKMLEQAGVAVINVASGTHQTLHKSNDIMRLPEGWKLPIWEAIKEAVSIPTIASGGHKSPELCEKVIDEGKADFVGLARQMLADPEWPNKAKEGKIEDIRKCISCLQCLYRLGGGPMVVPRCAVNPELGRKRYFTEIKPVTVKKKVFIIGGGPAGMEAARVASLRGHDVTLYEKESQLGGQLLLAGTVPGKQIIFGFRDYLVSQLEKLNVKVKLATEATPELLDKENPDAVIVATGAEPLIPDIPGINGERVVTAFDVIMGKTMVKNQKTAILGGGMIGCETAELLAEQGNEVTVVEMLPLVGADMDPLNRRGLLDQLNEYKVQLLTGLEIVEIDDQGTIVVDKKTGEKRTIAADLMILALGTRSVRNLAEALEGNNIPVYTIGDSQEPRKIMEAVYEGSLVGRQI